MELRVPVPHNSLFIIRYSRKDIHSTHFERAHFVYIMSLVVTEYFCTHCKIRFFEEEELPNMNMRHRRCGMFARVLRFEKEPRKSQ